MSAPNTNIEKQEERHKPALIGMGAAVLWSVVLLVLLVGWVVYQGNDPEGAETQIDGRTGAEETVAD